MNAARLQKPDAFRSWSTSFVAGSVLTAAILLLLAFAHRERVPSPPVSESTGIRMQSIDVPEQADAAAAPAASPNLSSLLPASPPTEIAPLTVDTPAVDLSVDLSQMLEWRYSYADLGKTGSQAGSFGVSNFADVDEKVQNIIIPPKLFPEELIDAGIVQGRVVVTMLIDEKGRATVKNVLSSTHPTFVPMVVEAMRRSLFSIPMRDGKPTKVLINRVVVFNADPARVARRRAAQSL